MNIEKLAHHLKEFTLDEIEMIAECDCKTELEQLLNENKIVFKRDLYKYVEVVKEKTFDLYPKPTFRKKKSLLFNDVAKNYLTNRKLTKDTFKRLQISVKIQYSAVFWRNENQ